MPYPVATINTVADKVANYASTASDATFIATAEEALVMVAVSMLGTVRVCTIHVRASVTVVGIPAVYAGVSIHVMCFCFLENYIVARANNCETGKI